VPIHIIAHDTATTPLALEARPMPRDVFTSRLAASKPKPAILAEQIRWYAARLRTINGHLIADDLDGIADAVAQLRQALADTRLLLEERDARVRHLEAIIEDLSHGQVVP
jgi:hypothetical protein